VIILASAGGKCLLPYFASLCWTLECVSETVEKQFKMFLRRLERMTRSQF
jgi:hypothetical protein